ncbi:DUF305 domain-containing protein [Ornithinimicrobium tianjinense]|uniref:Lipoprotein n=1 Tax=Ornithinimicrobium tianjinense TaxID=1195761 RepID=A0A917BRM9_9MICO|nr:DUF305 domain-containing protein [Ornithinimicrobium tianjinense]GGF53483.1 lipoprotein [Ornithinimicrobium tianjinense]
MPSPPASASLVSLVLGAALLAGCSASQTPTAVTVTPDRPVIQPGGPGEANATLTGPIAIPVEEPNEADVRFAQAMIIHHAQALEMVEIARDGLEDQAVRGLAERIAAAQGPEVGALVGWLVRHDEPVPQEAVEAGVDVKGLGGRVGARSRGHAGHDAEEMAGMATADQLEALGTASGRAADVLFLELMTAHHEGALVMTTEHGTQGIDAQAREMSDEMHVEQTAEIDRMAELLATLRG